MGGAAILVTLTLLVTSAQVQATPTSSTATTRQLDQIIKAVKGTTRATFRATYGATDAGVSSFTFEQGYGSFRFVDSSLISLRSNDATFLCTTSSNPPVCTEYPGISVPTSDPAVGFRHLFSSSTVIPALKEMVRDALVRVAGVSVVVRSSTIGGVESNCATIKVIATSVTYCIGRKVPLITKISDGGSIYKLTSFSQRVRRTDFALPRGATVVVVPSS